VSSIDHHIAQIARRNGWKHFTVKETIWNSTQWTTTPKLIIKGDFLVVEFHSYIPAAAPSGTWQFNSAGTQVTYDRTTTKVLTTAADAMLHSTQVTQHKDALTYKPQVPEPTAYTWIRIISLTEDQG
jgi:hypothetical protein